MQKYFPSWYIISSEKNIYRWDVLIRFITLNLFESCVAIRYAAFLYFMDKVTN
jgi:hypothetical protein